MADYTLSFKLYSSKRSEGKSTQIIDCLHVGDTNYTIANGYDLATAAADFTPVDADGNNVIMNGIDLNAPSVAASGAITVILEGGGSKTLNFLVAAGDSRRAFWGERIKTIVYASTTFTGKMFPNF